MMGYGNFKIKVVEPRLLVRSLIETIVSPIALYNVIGFIEV